MPACLFVKHIDKVFIAIGTSVDFDLTSTWHWAIGSIYTGIHPPKSSQVYGVCNPKLVIYSLVLGLKLLDLFFFSLFLVKLSLMVA